MSRRFTETTEFNLGGPTGLNLSGGELNDLGALRFRAARRHLPRVPPDHKQLRFLRVFRSSVYLRVGSDADSVDVVSTADVIILTGPPGAGKSTTARALAPSYSRSVHLHTDDFWHYIVSGAIPPYLPESDGQNQTVMRVIRDSAFAYAAGGFVTVIDGIIGPWMLGHFRDTGEKEAVPRLHYVVLRAGRDETLRRAQGRRSPDALVDENPVLSLWDQFADLGALGRHVIDTTDQKPAETLAAVQTAIGSGAFVLEANTSS